MTIEFGVAGKEIGLEKAFVGTATGIMVLTQLSMVPHAVLPT
jgi:hypothetical protein